MRVPREAGEEVLRVVVPEVVEEQERVEIRGVAEAEGALKLHASALHGGFGAAEPFDRANRHCRSPLVLPVYFIYKLSATGSSTAALLPINPSVMGEYDSQEQNGTPRATDLIADFHARHEAWRR